MLFYGVVDICSSALEAYINTHHLAQLFIFYIYQRIALELLHFKIISFEFVTYF